MTFVYPTSDLDRHRTLIALLGSFWSRTYTGIDQIHSYVNATAELVAQSHLNVLELAASLSRFEIPVFHTENWLPITLKKSQTNTKAISAFRFDKTNRSFNSSDKFNDTLQVETYGFVVEPKLESVPQIFDKLTFPTVTLSQNADYIIDKDKNAIVFVNDPFANPAFLRRGIYDGGALVDEEIVLWGFRAQLDYNLVFEQFAYAVGLYLKSSENAKKFINAIFSALIDSGATVATFAQAISAVCGVDVVRETDETVEVITLDAHGLLIVTDKHAYRFDATATPVVTVGQRVRVGDPLVSVFEVLEFTRGTPPAGLSALALDRGFTAACFYGDLIFENEDVPLEINENHSTGYTFVKFKLSGFPQDVDLFFEELHQRGIEAAEYLKLRNPCFEKPLKHPTKDKFPVPGHTGSVYLAADTGLFYQWHETVPAIAEQGAYAELTEFERCHPPWQQFPNASTFPTRGNTKKIYLDAATGKFYRWVIQVPATPAMGKYVEAVRPHPLSKLGTLAHLLDKREQPEGEPKAENLPSKINPLGFLVKNVFRNNVFAVVIRVSALGHNPLGLYNIRHIQQVLPPNSAVFFVFELGGIKDTKNGANDTQDAISRFTGMTPLQDPVPELYVKDRGVMVRNISGTCQ